MIGRYKNTTNPDHMGKLFNFKYLEETGLSNEGPGRSSAKSF